MVNMYIIYYIVLFIIFYILYKIMLIDLKKKLEKSKKIYLFYRQLAYICLL